MWYRLGIVTTLLLFGRTALAQAPSTPIPLPSASREDAPTLTRPEAEQLALRNNPRVAISHLLALAQHQVVREFRSGELPQINGSLTGEAAYTGSRVPSGSLQDPRLFSTQEEASH